MNCINQNKGSVTSERNIDQGLNYLVFSLITDIKFGLIWFNKCSRIKQKPKWLFIHFLMYASEVLIESIITNVVITYVEMSTSHMVTVFMILSILR